MDSRRLFLIGDLPGLTPQISRLVSMMNYARWTTLAEVAGLTMEELDYLHDAESNSIGALLLHIAAIETSYQAATFESRGLSPAEMKEWGAALRLGPQARREIRGHDLRYYLRTLETVRERTLGELRRRDDEWLDEETPFWNHRPANNWFKWFHVCEDEINHRGQIRWLRKRAVKHSAEEPKSREG